MRRILFAHLARLIRDRQERDKHMFSWRRRWRADTRLVSIEECCREFYGSQVFHPLMFAFWQTVYESLREVDQSFAVVDQSDFQREMTALYTEIFGVAWMHIHGLNNEYLIREIGLTKIYLVEKEKADIWESMADYGLAISGSPGEQQVRQLLGATLGDSEVIGKFLNRYRELLRKSRVEFAEQLVRTGLNDSECTARLANRLSTSETWDDTQLQALTDTIAMRLGCDLNLEGQFRLRVVLHGLYKGAMQYIKSAKIVEPVKLRDVNALIELARSEGPFDFFTKSASVLLIVLDWVFFPTIILQGITTLVLGILAELTAGLILFPFSLLWMVLLAPLLATSWLWIRVPIVRPMLLVPGVLYAKIAGTYAALITEMGDWEARVVKQALCESWPHSIHVLKIQASLRSSNLDY